MEKKEGSKHLIDLMLDKNIKREKGKFADVTLQELQELSKKKKVIAELDGRTADSQWLKKE